MYHVLIPVDTDEQRTIEATDATASLAANGCEVRATLLNVFEEFDATEGESRVSSSELYDPDSFPDTVIDARERLAAREIETDTRREHGEPADRIVAVAREIDADAIVIGGRKRSPISKALLGSTTQKVLLNADRPVTVCPAD